jgi:hydrogenase expression/formation protein HypE
MSVAPPKPDATVALKHGSGSRAMRRLIAETLTVGLGEIGMAPAVEEVLGLDRMDDGAALRIGDRWLVLTTDSHVIHPVFFPGGDIGRLAVSGTVNDLAMMGATEVLALSSSVILEDGFPLAELERIQRSMVETCREARAPIVCGDTKVMGRGELDGIVLNTTGVALTPRVVTDAGLRPGDRLVVTGTIGDHGFAVLAARSALGLAGELRSDVAPLNGLVRVALETAGEDLVAMKDPTRGGVASALAEMAAKSGVGVVLDEASLPKTDAVRAAAELLGIDPLHVANEGKAILGVRERSLEGLLDALRAHPLGRQAACIGVCTGERVGQLVLDTGFGRRLLAELEGEPLPRIC